MRARHGSLIALALLVGLLSTAAASPGSAESEVRIAQQFGLSYLPLHVAIDRKLIEKHAKALGAGDVNVKIVRLASGAAVNDAIISGAIDVAMAGLTVLLNLHDKTGGRNPVKGMMAIADTPIYFNTIEPRLKTIADIGPNDRIAMTAGKGTQHAVVLQMAAAKLFGWEQRAKLDALAVGMSHPDGVVGLLSGGGAFSVHATTVPFIQLELADKRVHTILSSFDVVGGRHTLIAAYAAQKWRSEQPALYEATYKALSEAMTLIAADPAAAAALFLRVEPSKLSHEVVLGILKDPAMMHFSPTPTGVMAYADYMAKSGFLKSPLASWKDAFFDNVHALPGN